MEVLRAWDHPGVDQDDDQESPCDIETGWNSPLTEPITITVQADPEILRISALFGNLPWRINRLAASPLNGIVKPTRIRTRILKMYGRSSGFTLRRLDDVLFFGYLLDRGHLPGSILF